jgi:multicomponent Na+:H+ antiporter subunit B
VLFGLPFMTAAWATVGAGPLAFAVGTPLVFDLGVFLAVIGVVLTIVFTLGDVARAED